MQPPFPLDRLSEIINQVKPKTTITSIEPIPTPQLLRLFKISLSDSTNIFLTIPPPIELRLLRQERELLKSQITLLTYLNDDELLNEDFIPSDNPTQTSNDCIRSPELSQLIIPKILKFSLSEKDLTTPYILSNLSPSPPPPGKHLSKLTSPTGKFGPVAEVLSHLITSPSPTSPIRKSENFMKQGYETWSQAFIILLECAMRDAEDMLVHLPYIEMRRYLRIGVGMGWFDEVRKPSLIFLEMGNGLHGFVGHQGDWSGAWFGDVEILGEVDDGDEENKTDSTELADKLKDENRTKEEVCRRFRHLMYECYKAVVAISIAYQRPRGDSMERDDKGRIRLVRALRGLEMCLAVAK